jgi:hypothetical protein
MKDSKRDEPQKDLHILVSESIHLHIKVLAAKSSMTISAYCIKMILQGKVTARFTPDELNLLRKLASVSNNLNQATKRLHLQTDPVTIALAEDMIISINKMLSAAQEKSN